MNYQDRYLRLWSSLKAIQSIWHYNLLLEPEKALKDVDIYLDELAGFSESTLHALHHLKMPSKASANFQDTFCALFDESLLPKWKKELALSTLQQQGLKPKKIHEMARLLSFLKEKQAYSTYMDIGAGLGHLSRHLQWALNQDVLSVEKELTLSSKAAELSSQAKWLDPSRIKHICGEAPGIYQDLNSFKNPSTLSLGLHTCGSLAWHHVRLVEEGMSVFNFACCYDKLANPKTELNVSRLSKTYFLDWSREALFNVTRGAKKRSLEDFRFQKRVQIYRYALQHLLNENFPELNVVSVGNTPPSVYQADFSDYCENRLKVLGLELLWSKKSIEGFFRSFYPSYTRKWLAVVLRETCLRGLEWSIHLDRAIYFQEKTHQVELGEFFERELSPRNIGIFIKPL